MIACADFETTTDTTDCRVWAWGICEVGNIKNFFFGNTMESFMKYCKNYGKSLTLYFHNLKFDGEFIIAWLLKNGYKWVKEHLEEKTFSTLISDKGVFTKL